MREILWKKVKFRAFSTARIRYRAEKDDNFEQKKAEAVDQFEPKRKVFYTGKNICGWKFVNLRSAVGFKIQIKDSFKIWKYWQIEPEFLTPVLCITAHNKGIKLWIIPHEIDR